MRKFFCLVIALLGLVSCYKVSLVDDTKHLIWNLDIGFMESYPFISVDSFSDYSLSFEGKYDWVSVYNVERGAERDILTFYCAPNVSKEKRYALIKLTNATTVIDVSLVQSGIDNGVACVIGDSIVISTEEPGTVYPLCKLAIDGVTTEEEYGEEIWGDITNVTILGPIDARDFSTLKWNFRNLENLDLSDVTISFYAGEYGTNEGYYDEVKYPYYSKYYANEIPIGAFFYWCSHDLRSFPNELYDEGMKSLQTVKLPSGIHTIRRNAFARAYNLKEINIPEGVTRIEMVAFRYCTSIEKLYLPESLNDIGWLALTELTSLKEVHIAAKKKPKEDEEREGEARTFGNRLDAYQLEDILGNNHRGSVVNVKGMEPYNPQTGATLYVPSGCKDEYSEWKKYFKDIVEE